MKNYLVAIAFLALPAAAADQRNAPSSAWEHIRKSVPRIGEAMRALELQAVTKSSQSCVVRLIDSSSWASEVLTIVFEDGSSPVTGEIKSILRNKKNTEALVEKGTLSSTEAVSLRNAVAACSAFEASETNSSKRGIDTSSFFLEVSDRGGYRWFFREEVDEAQDFAELISLLKAISRRIAESNSVADGTAQVDPKRSK